MFIKWTEPAIEDLGDILCYFISENNEEIGQDIVTRLFQSVDRLAEFPDSGRHGLIAGTREIVPYGLPYLLIYHILDDSYVEILTVIHTARQRK